MFGESRFSRSGRCGSFWQRGCGNFFAWFAGRTTPQCTPCDHSCWNVTNQKCNKPCGFRTNRTCDRTLTKVACMRAEWLPTCTGAQEDPSAQYQGPIRTALRNTRRPTHTVTFVEPLPFLRHFHRQESAEVLVHDTTPRWHVNSYYNMTMWILAGNGINFSIAAGLIRLYSIHVPGWLQKWLNLITAPGSVSNEPGSVTWLATKYLKTVSWRNHTEKLTTWWAQNIWFWLKINIPSSYFTILMLNYLENTLKLQFDSYVTAVRFLT